jgi:hypothetical protein
MWWLLAQSLVLRRNRSAQSMAQRCSDFLVPRSSYISSAMNLDGCPGFDQVPFFVATNAARLRSSAGGRWADEFRWTH